MCGRIACTLAADVVCKACSYRDPITGAYKMPDWRDHPVAKDQSASYTYYPSVNVSPTRFTPVMYKSIFKKGEQEVNDPTTYSITPMMFGMIPSYHKGEAKSHGLSTNNCRLEGLPQSKLYKRVLDQRKVCIVLAQGFYEWKTVGAEPKKGKQPYLIFSPQNADVKIADDSAWENAEWNEKDGWKGPKILKMAGLFDIWKSPSGDEVYSYTVITMESNNTISWLHDRMPAILDTEEQVQGWLNATSKVTTNELLSILKPVQHLQWYPVDSKVGNSRCHDVDCMQPMEVKENKSKTFMDNWLKKKPPVKAKREDEEESEEQSTSKKPKIEDE